MLFETLLVFVVATVAGIFSGIMPGIGIFVTITIAYPFLLQIDPINVVLFYVVLTSIDQYYNGISAIVFGIPGYSTNIPSVIEGHNLFLNDKGSDAIMFSAISSWLLSLFAVTLLIFIYPLFWFFTQFMTSQFQFIIFFFTLVIMVFFSQNKFYINVLLLFVGLFLAKIGYHNDGTDFFTFGYIPLYNGIPVLAITTAFFVIPMFLKTYLEKSSNIYWPEIKIKKYSQYFKEIIHYRWTLFRSGIFGCVGGFIPGLSYHSSTLISYYIERNIRIKQKKYKEGDINCLIASEGSNNAGVFTQLLPLIFLGIPITASEGLIYDLLESRGLSLTINFFHDMLYTVVIGFIISSTIGLFIAGKYINLLKIISGIKLITVYIFITIILFSIIFLLGNMTMNGTNHIMITMALIPFGLLLYKYDVTPLLYGFFLQEKIFEVSQRLIIFYF